MAEDVEKETNEQESKWAWVWPMVAALIALAFILLVLWANYEWKDWLVGHLPRQNAEIDSAEKFGAVFGFAGALFTGLAFVGLIYAIFLQRQEVKMARQALKQARDELKIAQDNQVALNEQLARQNREVEKKSFEDTFFQLLSFHAEILQHIALEKDLSGLESIYRANEFLFGLASQAPNIDEFRIKYDNIYESSYRSHFGHYFRSCYYIFEFIHKSEVANKAFYAKLARAKFSDREVELLMFNGIGKFGEQFKPLIEKYALLNNLPYSKYQKWCPYLLEEYSDSAFA